MGVKRKVYHVGSSEGQLNAKVFRLTTKPPTSEPLKIAYVQLPCRSEWKCLLGTDNEAAAVEASKSRNECVHATINTAELTQPPPQASLLGLPPELRNRIYQHLWPGDLIHVATRPCKPYDNKAWRTNFMQPTWAPQSRFVRWTHIVCQVPRDWEKTYRLSKDVEPAQERVIGFSEPLPTVSEQVMLPDRHARHDQCHWIQESFLSQSYISQCAHQWHVGHDPSHCDEQKRHNNEMSNQYGPPPSGLETLYTSSKIHTTILTTCRQIHREPCLIPYANSVWQFDYPSTLQEFFSRALTPSQISAVRSLHIDGWPWNDTYEAIACLPNLRKLQYSSEFSTSHCGRKGVVLALVDKLRKCKTRAETRKLERVEVIMGCDAGPVGQGELRCERRALAEELEELLLGKIAECGHDGTATY